ncbi:methyltransferase domain-containing protein [Prauserella halophila]|uniref:methyltransferase domain-containing protein n=2 Tax=Actinomycetes TaxID=1760 RepID=UPI0020A4A364|nr:methyltransferase domain-containing protein [Prauserella halophila]
MGELGQAFRDVWEYVGRTDPYWGVMSYPDRRGGRWDLDEFFAYGVRDMTFVRNLMESRGVGLGDRVLDFGCGVGRLSRVLAEDASAVVGVDIADSMLVRARELNADQGRVEFRQVDGRRLPFDDDSFDGAISLMVLQHSPPAVQLAALAELVRVVRPGGLLVVHAVAPSPDARELGAEVCRAEIDVVEVPASMCPGVTGMVRARVTNRGVAEWPVGEEIRLGNHWLEGGAVAVQDDGRVDLPHVVRPGERVELTMSVRAPDVPGRYELELDMMQELVAWWSQFDSPTVRTPVLVTEDAEPAQQVADSVPASYADVVAADTEGIEMHPIPISLMQGLFQHMGGTVLAIEPDPFSEPPWDSRTYLVRF